MGILFEQDILQRFVINNLLYTLYQITVTMNKIVFLSALIMLLGTYEGVDGYKIAEPEYKGYREPEGNSSSITSEPDVIESITIEVVGESYYNEDEVTEDYDYEKPEITATEMPVEEELNCMMQYPSESTDEIDHCCKVMDHDNATTYTAKEIEKCMLLSMKVLFGYEADVDIIELAKSSRGFVSCPIAENKKYLTMVGCYKRTCKEYERAILRSVCFACL